MNILRGDETVANSSAGQVIIRIRTFKGWTISDPPFNNLALLSLHRCYRCVKSTAITRR
jgi:hypothetical protein